MGQVKLVWERIELRIEQLVLNFIRKWILQTGCISTLVIQSDINQPIGSYRHEYELWSQALNVCIYPKHRPHLKLTLNKCIKGCTKGISEGDTDCQHPTVFSQKYQG